MELGPGPELTPVPGGFYWTLDAPYYVIDDALGRIDIPQGFITDLGSIPRMFWNIIPPEGPGTCAYVTHDWLYAQQSWPRSSADACLLRLLKFLDVGASRYVIYSAVRTFGWIAWNKHKNKPVMMTYGAAG